MGLFSDFLSDCQEERYWKTADRLLLAVSGGVDSMVLLHLLLRLPSRLQPWFAVVHVNHALRQASDHEELFLEKYCAQEKIPFFKRRWNAETHPEAGVEEAARNFRYGFFKEIMQDQHATHLLTAHHADDQAETILMRLVRGGQLSSMAGIQLCRPFDQGLLVRPLLKYSKEELYAYSQAHGIKYFEDSTNTDLGYTRNRYRQNILPLLKKENKQVLEHFLAFSSDLEDLLEISTPIIEEKVKKTLRTNDEHSKIWDVDIPILLSYSPSLQRQVMNHIFKEVFKNASAEFAKNHIEQAIVLSKSSKPNGQIDLPGHWTVLKEYERLIIFKKAEKKAEDSLFQSRLHLGHWTRLPHGARIGLFYPENFFNCEDLRDKQLIWLDPQDVELPLIVRHRRSGDRMTLKGMKSGTKKVKDIFIDQKIPAKKRDEALLVTDDTGEIIWLVEYKESRLSIEQETDKIQYILVYQK